ncbi:cupin domain-containing protein [Actinoplanes sp. NPDC049548]|uniref:cupin domain-containing protein n=1 Tax=Actinoplanes sp. NPDC049548 TaxID=3155152 RepID=UPI003441E8A9
MHVIHTAQAPRFEVPGVEFTALAAPSRGSAEICTWRITVAPGLRSPEPHTLDHDEIFMVVGGTVQLTPASEPLGPGDAAVVPAGEPIQLGNPGDEPAEVYVAIRAGFVARSADGTPVGTPPWAH